jgi:pimeloyl-ACP methyl ester carboxylesterase
MPHLITPDGRRLTWHEVGSGEPLLLHPGGPGMSSAYFGDLPELASERTLLLLDPRGTGDSDRPADAAAYELADYANDVEEVRRHLGLERLDVLGHSHGGFVAMTWASAFPQSVGRLVLANTAARFTDAIRAARAARVAQHEGQPYYADAVEALRLHAEGRYASDEELRELYRREAPLLLAPETTVVGLDKIAERAGANADALRYFNDHIAAGMDLRAAVTRVDAPTLVITGELDPFGESTAREIADAVPNATLVVLAGADHFPFLEPENRPAWSETVARFLAGSRSQLEGSSTRAPDA